MTSLPIDVTEAVTAAINVATLSLSVTAERKYLVAAALEDMGVLHVSVAPRSLKSTPLDRDRCRRETTVDIGIQQRLSEEGGAVSNDDLDARMALAQEIADIFERKALPGHTSSRWVGTEITLFLPDHLERFGQLTSVVSLTFKEAR